jgi:geranylgeranyl pyrophosphate synthase
MTDLLNTTALPPQGLDFEAALDKTEQLIQSHLKNAPLVIRPQTRHLAKAGGKKIRARTLLACALKRDGRIDAGAATAAAAIELMHLATLVHDDIIDDASTRRGIKTLNKKFGEKSAVLCGDYLLSLALQLASGIGVPEHRTIQNGDALPGYLAEVCLGELRQNQNLYRYDLSEREYFKTIIGKTAALFEASFLLGFLFSDEAQEARETYVQLGKLLGIIFQLADDCADYEATQKTSKKPVLFDYAKGVITLPLIRAMKVDQKLRAEIEAGLSPQEVKEAVTAAGGLAYTHAKIRRNFKEADKIIAEMDAEDDKKDRLITLFEKACGLEKG